MVSEITTVRLWSQQTALKAFKEVADENASQSSAASSGSSLADILYSGGSEDEADDDTSLSRLIASLQQTIAEDVPAEEAADGAVGDIESRAFMKALSAKLEELKGSGSTSVMAQAMLEALDAGTLTVTDAVAGEAVTAWNPADAEAGAAVGKTAVATTDWTNFLKQHLARDGGLYVRNADSSHQDRLTGASAYFGMIGETYYYISWTAPREEASATPAAPAG